MLYYMFLFYWRAFTENIFAILHETIIVYNCFKEERDRELCAAVTKSAVQAPPSSLCQKIWRAPVVVDSSGVLLLRSGDPPICC